MIFIFSVFSVYHSSPFKLHLSLTGYSWTRWLARTGKRDSPAPPAHPEGNVYDSVFVLSSGRVTSIGPQGEFNWQVLVIFQLMPNKLILVLQVDTRADWDSASEVIYNSAHPSWKGDPLHVLFVHGIFTPSAQSFSMHSYGSQVNSLILVPTVCGASWKVGCIDCPLLLLPPGSCPDRGVEESGGAGW